MSELKELLDRALDAVRKDLKHISFEVVKGKLSASEAKDLVSYTKLLVDVVDREKEDDAVEDAEIAKLTDEELKKRAQSILKKGP